VKTLTVSELARQVVEVPTRPSDFATRDPVLDAAVRYLSARR
jgi:hypothetical protein